MAEEEKKAPETPAEETKPAEEAAKPVDEASSPRPETEATPDQKPTDSADGRAGAPSPAADAKPDAAEKPSEVDWKLQYAHLLADFDNYKKRAARDRDDTYRYVESQVLKDLLPTVDNLGLALANVAKSATTPAPDTASKPVEQASSPAPSATFASFVKGVQLVYDGLLKMLKDHEAEPFDSVGQDLDTEKMEAIAHLPSPDIAEGKVSIESKKGWLLKGKVLRPAQVVVSSGKPA